MKFFNEEGVEVEGFSKEEMEAKLKEQQDAEVAKQADKQKNFDQLRQEKEEAEKKATDAQTALTTKEQEIVQKERDKLVDAISEGNKELKDKIQHHVKRFEAEIKTPEDFQRVLSDAYTLSAGQQMPDKLNNVISSAGASGGKNDGAPKVPLSNPEAMSVAKKMGLTEEEIIQANL